MSGSSRWNWFERNMGSHAASDVIAPTYLNGERLDSGVRVIVQPIQG
jgi:hypothetical protein